MGLEGSAEERGTWSGPRSAFAALAGLLVASAIQGCNVDRAAARGLSDTAGSAPPRYDYYIMCPFGNVDLLDDFLDAEKYPLEDLLASPSGKYQGILVLNVLPFGVWKSMLDYVPKLAQNPDAAPPADVAGLHEEAQRKARKLPQALKEAGRVRILTPLDLASALASASDHLGGEKLQKWLAHSTYDLAKLAASLMAVRVVGSRVPVVRLDTGVLFNFHTVGNLTGVRALVEASVDDYHASLKNVLSQSFIVSQQYTGVKVNNGTIPFDTWNEAYATQAVPPLLATPELCDASQFVGSFPDGKHFPSGAAVQKATDATVMRQFYGVAPRGPSPRLEAVLPSGEADSAARREADATKMGLAYIGASPTHSLISGAGLAIGPGVALDMPPFLETDLFVMWLDDHLLDRMTAEVLATKRRVPDRGAGGARWPDVRGPQRNAARFALEFYMPTLTMGAVFDKWINSHPDAHLLKFRKDELPAAIQGKLEALKPASGEAMGPFTKAMQQVRFTGASLDNTSRSALEADLWKAALSRLQDCYWQWSRLPEPEVDGTPTPPFAKLWATGRVCKYELLGKYCDDSWEQVQQPCARGAKFCVAAARGMVLEAWDAKARAAASRAALPELTQEDLSPAFRQKLQELVASAQAHLDWTLDWALLVQAMRSLPPGAVRTDLSRGSGHAPSPPLAGYKIPALQAQGVHVV